MNIAKLHVLIAEDNPINQGILVEVFKRIGARVFIAKNGQEAVLKVCGTATTYDVVLMDVHMPVMDGLEATRRIRADGRFDKLPILAMTGAVFQHELQQCIDAGMNAYIGKPFEIDHLMETVRFWTANNAASTAPAPTACEVEQPATTTGGEPPLPHLDGLDAAAGLKRSNGNRRLYFRLLHDFIDDSQAKWQALTSALQANELTQAINIVHAAKGVSANLGFVRLRALAADLEIALSQGADADRPLELFKSALEQVWQALPAQIAMGTQQPQPIPPSDALDPGTALTVWKQLQAYVHSYDGLADDYFSAHQDVLSHWMSSTAMEQLSFCLKRYDFAGAARVLENDELLRFAYDNPV